MSASIYNHKHLNPTGANTQPSQQQQQQHSPARLNECFDSLRQEYDVLIQEINLYRSQRDEFENKVTGQVNELNIIRQSLYDLESQHTKIRQQYEDELRALRQELHSLRQSTRPDRDGIAGLGRPDRERDRERERDLGVAMAARNDPLAPITGRDVLPPTRPDVIMRDSVPNRDRAESIVLPPRGEATGRDALGLGRPESHAGPVGLGVGAGPGGGGGGFGDFYGDRQRMELRERERGPERERERGMDMRDRDIRMERERERDVRAGERERDVRMSEREAVRMSERERERDREGRDVRDVKRIKTEQGRIKAAPDQYSPSIPPQPHPATPHASHQAISLGPSNSANPMPSPGMVQQGIGMGGPGMGGPGAQGMHIGGPGMGAPGVQMGGPGAQVMGGPGGPVMGGSGAPVMGGPGMSGPGAQGMGGPNAQMGGPNQQGMGMNMGPGPGPSGQVIPAGQQTPKLPPAPGGYPPPPPSGPTRDGQDRERERQAAERERQQAEREAGAGGNGPPADALDLSLDPQNVPPDMKKEGPDWFAVFHANASGKDGKGKMKRALDVTLVHTLMHESVVCCVRFSADGKYLATGCNRTAQIYDTKTGQKTCVLKDEGASKTGDLYIRSVCFSPDGKYLATGAEDKLIRIWDIAKKRIFNTFDGHQQEIYSLDFSRDGKLIVSGSGDRTARIWKMEDGTSKILPINEPDPADAGVTSVCISPDGRLVAAGSLDTIVRIWDVQTGLLIERLRGHEDSVYSVAFTPDGKGLVSGSLDKTLKYWDLRSVLRARDAPGPKNGIKEGEKSSQCTMNFSGHKDYVLSVAVSHDGQWVVSGSKDRGVQFWDAKTAVAQCMLQGHKNSVISIDLSPAGNILATGSGDWQARIWSYSTL